MERSQVSRIFGCVEDELQLRRLSSSSLNKGQTAICRFKIKFKIKYLMISAEEMLI
jgi:hypothetical protein